MLFTNFTRPCSIMTKHPANHRPLNLIWLIRYLSWEFTILVTAWLTQKSNVFNEFWIQSKETLSKRTRSYPEKRERVNSEHFFHYSQTGYNLRDQSYTLATNRCRLELRKNFFSQRVVKPWNKLPSHVVTLNAFKNRFDLLKSGRCFYARHLQVQVQIPRQSHFGGVFFRDYGAVINDFTYLLT